MKVKIIAAIAIKGQHQEPGTIVDLPTGEAIELIFRGRAEEVKEVENRSVGLKRSKQKTVKRCK